MPGSSKISNAALAWLFFFSGLVALVYEAIWQRRFSLVFGSAAPATAAVLAAYFAGLAVGSFFIGKRVHQFQSPLKLYAGLEFGIFFGALLVEPLLSLFDTIPLSTLPTPLLLTAKTFLAFVALAL
ncbi:MAG TPA: spermidine synthase, partial [Verrucomicrobiae bacterium]